MSRGSAQSERYTPRGSSRDSGDYYSPRVDRDRNDRFSASKTEGEKYQDPYTLNTQIPFSQFCEYLQQNSLSGPDPTHDQLVAKYNDYKLDLYARLSRGFVVQHRDEEWFKEKYDDAIAEPIKQSIIDYRKLCHRDFMDSFNAGKFDGFTLESDRPQLPFSTFSKNDSFVDAARHEKAADGDIVFDNKSDDGNTVADPELKPESKTDHADGAEELGSSVDDQGKKVLLIKTVGPHVSRKQLEDLAKTIPGFLFLSLSDPNPSKRYHRIGWIILSPESNVEASIKLIEDQKISFETSEFVVHVGQHVPMRPMKRKYLFPYMSSIEYVRKDHENSYRAAKRFESEFKDPEYENTIDKIRERSKEIATDAYNKMLERKKAELAEQDEEGMVIEEDDESHLQTAILKKELDLTILYLRQVYSFCYYCVCICDSICDLSKKCTAGHLRRVLPGADVDASVAQAFTKPDSRTEGFIESWKARLELFLSPTQSDLRKLGGRPVEESVKEMIDTHIMQEDEGKFRCKIDTCAKLFKGEDFCRKHIERRHADWIESLEAQAKLLNNYVMDPCRVLPPRPEGRLPIQSKDGVAADNGSSSRPSTLVGLPVAYPPYQPPANTGNGHSRVPANGYLQADPFAYNQNDTDLNLKNGEQKNPPSNYYSPAHRGSGDRRRYRSRSPPSRRDSFGRRDYRDRSDYRPPPHDFDRVDSPRGPRPIPSKNAGDPRGRKLTSYMDIDGPPPPALDY